MSDRVNGFVVTLEQGVRDDDAELIADAIRLLRRVIRVESLVADPGELMWRNQVRYELEVKILEAMRS